MPEKVSPEERLFKVIQNGKNAPAGDKRAEHKRGLGPFWLKRGQTPFIGHAQHAAILALPASLRPEELKTINRLLIIVLVIIAALAFYYLLNTKPTISHIIEEISAVPFQRKQKEAIEVFKPLGFYLEAVKKRDILRPVPEEVEVVEEQVVVEEAPPEPKLPTLASTLKLQGISWGPVPKAMIQDTSDGQVYFVRTGQRVGATEIQVKEISKDKVLLGYEEEELELL